MSWALSFKNWVWMTSLEAHSNIAEVLKARPKLKIRPVGKSDRVGEVSLKAHEVGGEKNIYI